MSSYTFTLSHLGMNNHFIELSMPLIPSFLLLGLLIMHQVLIQFELSNLIDEFSAHGITLDRSSKYTIEEQLIHQIKKKIDEEEDKSV